MDSNLNLPFEKSGKPSPLRNAIPGETGDPAVEPFRSAVGYDGGDFEEDDGLLEGLAEDYEDENELETDSVFMQNRELSWLAFNERVLDLGADESVPLLDRLNFISIFTSNLQEFFMVRVGSLTDLTILDPPITDSKTGMTAKEQLRAIHERCHELTLIQESIFEHVRGSLAQEGVRHLRPEDLSEDQRDYLLDHVRNDVVPFLSPQIINSRHPFPHLENGKLYIIVRLDDGASANRKAKGKKGSKKAEGGAEGVLLGLIPLPHQCERIVKLPGRGFQYILLEQAIEMAVSLIFEMYKIKHTNVIRVTRNADLDATQGSDELDDDYREHMRRLLKQRERLAPVRLECERPLSPMMEKLMLKRLHLKAHQVYDSLVPLDMNYTYDLGSHLSEKKRDRLSYAPFTPAWPTGLDRRRPIMDQVSERDTLLFYPYESMEPLTLLLREAALDPSVISIKITLYRMASHSHLADAIIAAAEHGKDVTALFELRARFDESNNIEWSQRFERAGCNVIYGFRNLKVHSKICSITRRLPDGSIQHITQLGTGNYNEKTARLYTDLCYITTNETFGRDALDFFRNMQLENISEDYKVLCVAPLQLKPIILNSLDEQIQRARQGLPCSAFLKANSLTDMDVIGKISEASEAGVPVTLFIRGISCLVPKIPGKTQNVRVVSIVGRLLEHSRIYCFGPPGDCSIYLSSADLMTRNLTKRVEITWPILNQELKQRILTYISICMHDTAKLRELRPNGTYTPLGAFRGLDEEGNPEPAYDSQEALIQQATAAAAEMASMVDRTTASGQDSATETDQKPGPGIAAEASMVAESGGGKPSGSLEESLKDRSESPQTAPSLASVPAIPAEALQNQAVAAAIDEDVVVPVVPPPLGFQPFPGPMMDPPGVPPQIPAAAPTLTDMRIGEILPADGGLNPRGYPSPMGDAAMIPQDGTLYPSTSDFFTPQDQAIKMPPKKGGFFNRRK